MSGNLSQVVSWVGRSSRCADPGWQYVFWLLELLAMRWGACRGVHRCWGAMRWGRGGAALRGRPSEAAPAARRPDFVLLAGKETRAAASRGIGGLTAGRPPPRPSRRQCFRAEQRNAAQRRAEQRRAEQRRAKRSSAERSGAAQRSAAQRLGRPHLAVAAARVRLRDGAVHRGWLLAGGTGQAADHGGGAQAVVLLVLQARSGQVRSGQARQAQ